MRNNEGFELPERSFLLQCQEGVILSCLIAWASYLSHC